MVATILIDYVTRTGHVRSFRIGNDYSWRGHVARIEASGGTVTRVRYWTPKGWRDMKGAVK